MQEWPHQTSIVMRKTINTENGMKTGDYVVAFDIENEMEKDKRRFDSHFI